MTEKVLIDHLKNYLGNQTIAKGKQGKSVAVEIATIFLSLDLKENLPFPSQKKLARQLNVSGSAIKLAWSLLSKTYKIFITSKRGGTMMVNKVSKAQKQRIRELIRTHNYASADIMFNMTALIGFDLVTIRQIGHAIREGVKLKSTSPVPKGNIHMKDAISFTLKWRSKLNYALDEVTYASRYDRLFIKICQSIPHDNKQKISIGPHSASQRSLLQEAGFVCDGEEFMRMNNTAMLNWIMASTNISLVHVQLSCIYPVFEPWNNASWQMLFKVQRQKEFMILIEDYIPGLPQAIALLQSIPAEAKDSIIFITRASNEVNFHNLWITAGPATIIKSITRKFNRPAEVAESVGYALSNLTRDNGLQRADKEAVTIALNSAKRAEELLIKSGMFNEDYILKRTGFCFYLSPKDGIPKGFYKNIKNHKVYIFLPKEYSNLKTLDPGFVISVANYQDPILLETHIEKLTGLLRRSILASVRAKKRNLHNA